MRLLFPSKELSAKMRLNGDNVSIWNMIDQITQITKQVVCSGFNDEGCAWRSFSQPV